LHQLEAVQHCLRQSDYLEVECHGARRLAAGKGCTPSQLALAWVLARGADVVPIPGTKRRTYLEKNVAAASIRLDAKDLAEIEAASPRSAVAGTPYPDMSAIVR
jgi:aryl-alcohol dehydrogenase-like predicted oxidoreductase